MRTLSLTIEGRLRDQLDVVSFSGTEAVNRLFSLLIDFTTDATDDFLEETLLQRSVTLSIADGTDVVRSFYGIAGAVEAHGAYSQDRRGYRLRLVPRMALLKRRRTRRIWPDVSALDVLAALAKDYSLLVRPRVARALAARPYCVQWDETDYAFITRLLSEEGLFFMFDHPKQAGGNFMMTSMGAAEVLVVSDTPDFYVPIDGNPELHFERTQAGSAMAAREDHVTHFAPRTMIRSSGARLRGYDMRRPTTELRNEALLDPKASGIGTSIAPAFEPRAVSIFEGSYEASIPAAPKGSTAQTVPSSAVQHLEALRNRWTGHGGLGHVPQGTQGGCLSESGSHGRPWPQGYRLPLRLV